MKRTGVIVIVGLALVALVIVLVSAGDDSGEDVPAPLAASAVSETETETDSAPAAVAATTLDSPLGSGKTLSVSRDELLASGGPLVVQLQLAQPEDPEKPLEGRILTEGRVLDLAPAVRGKASDVAEIEVDADWLTPARYIVEIKTSERSHFPLRRYAVEVH